MKLEKEEFIKKYSDKFTEEDAKIEFLEDATDSFEDKSEEFKEQITKLEEENSNLKQKYIDRFMKSETEGEDDKFPEKEEETLEEKEVIDIKEI